MDTRWAVAVAPKAARKLKAAPPSVKDRIPRVVAGLEDCPWPHGSEKLSSGTGLYKIRVGPYRLVYGVDPDVGRITILDCDRRDKIYRPAILTV